jgi:DNA-binding GntR family transcriptional regulator
MDENIFELIYKDLRAKILNETCRSGFKLSENQLAKEYGCSRTPIREVFKRLENDGFVVIKPKSGTYVRRDSQKEVIELIQVRAYLESLAFHLCLSTMTVREYNKLEKMKKELDRLVQPLPLDIMRFAQVHYDFHHHIVVCSKNNLLIKYFERLHLKSSYLFYQRMDEQTSVTTELEHEMILQYLKEKNPLGIEYMRDHLLRKYNLM